MKKQILLYLVYFHKYKKPTKYLQSNKMEKLVSWLVFKNIIGLFLFSSSFFSSFSLLFLPFLLKIKDCEKKNRWYWITIKRYQKQRSCTNYKHRVSNLNDRIPKSFEKKSFRFGYPNLNNPVPIFFFIFLTKII